MMFVRKAGRESGTEVASGFRESRMTRAPLGGVSLGCAAYYGRGGGLTLGRSLLLRVVGRIVP